MTSIFKSGAGEIERCLNARADDGLLQCLLALCRHHGNASTAEALVSGLPLESGRLTPALFERAASRAGFTSRVVFKRAEDIEEALLPAVLLQRDERACLLVGWSDGGNTARVIYPQLNETVVEVPRENLQAADTGTAILRRVASVCPTARSHPTGALVLGRDPRQHPRLPGRASGGIFHQPFRPGAAPVHHECL